jgi:phosphoribosylformimino-5-aminoimidazole carboxamide ribotide isomerase
VIVIPAIDLKEGRCVRLRQGRMQDETVYSTEPSEVARRWESDGAKLLHVVDLDGAVHGEPKNRNVIISILKAVKIPVQVGGGVRDLAVMDGYLSAGAARVVVGTAVYLDRELLEEASRRFPDRVIVAVDAKQGKLAVRGWTDLIDQDPADFVSRLKGYRLHAVIYTDIARDGMLEGPNLEGLSRMAAMCPIPLIASGGVTSLEDIRRVRSLGAKVIGVIVGKALYEGLIDLQAASAVA